MEDINQEVGEKLSGPDNTSAFEKLHRWAARGEGREWRLKLIDGWYFCGLSHQSDKISATEPTLSGAIEQALKMMR